MHPVSQSPLCTKILPPSLSSLKKSREATRSFFNIFGRGNVGLCNLELCVGEGGGVSASSARRRTFESPATEKEEEEKQQEQLGGLLLPPPPRDRAKARKSLLLLLLKVVHFGKGAKRQWGEPERSGRTMGRTGLLTSTGSPPSSVSPPPPPFPPGLLLSPRRPPSLRSPPPAGRHYKEEV